MLSIAGKRILLTLHILLNGIWIWGIAAIFLGVMILARWPVSGLWVIGLFVAIEMIFGGWAYIFIASPKRYL